MAVCFKEKHAGFQKNCCFDWSDPLKTVAKILFLFMYIKWSCQTFKVILFAYTEIFCRKQGVNNIEHTAFHS